MKFSEAMKLLEEGKKVRLKSWHLNEYIFIDSLGTIRDEQGEMYKISCMNSDWEEYIESETKKIEKLGYALEGIIDPTINERYLMRGVQANTDKINELIERMNELCGEK